MNFIVETKNEYTIQLEGILAPLIYEGFESIYLETKKVIKKGDENKLLKTFQQFIRKIPSWNENMINTETQRIITQSRCDWLSDLLKAVIKSNILLLSNSNQNISRKFKINEEHLNIPINKFIHKCYIESARQIYSIPDLFYHINSPINRKRNQRESLDIIKNSIKEAIRKMLPVQYILKQYLSNDFNNSDSQIEYNSSSNVNIKKKTPKDLKDNINQNVLQNFKSYDSSKESSDDIYDDKETANLLSEIKDKYTKGEIFGNESEKSEKDIQKGNGSSPSYNKLYILNKSKSENYLPSSDNVKLTSSSNKNKDESNNSINKDIVKENNSVKNESESNKRNSIEKNSIKSIEKNNVEMENSEKKKDTVTSDSITNNDESVLSSNSISYRIEKDSEYEAVFSNINETEEKNNINSIKERKKRKDSYFSNFNNI
jgi:hypothetical protein